MKAGFVHVYERTYLNDKGHSGTIFCFAPVRTVGMPSLVARCSLNGLGAVLYNSARSIVAECQRFFVGKITMGDNAVMWKLI